MGKCFCCWNIDNGNYSFNIYKQKLTSNKSVLYMSKVTVIVIQHKREFTCWKTLPAVKLLIINIHHGWVKEKFSEGLGQSYFLGSTYFQPNYELYASDH